MAKSRYVTPDEFEQEAAALGDEPADDLSNLDNYGEYIQNMRQTFQTNHNGRYYQLHVRITSLRHLGAVYAWMAEFGGASLRQYPNAKDVMSPDAAASCPFDFAAGVQIEYQVGSKQYGIDSGIVEDVIDFEHWMARLDWMGRTPEAGWVKAMRGDNHRNLEQAQSDEPAAPPQPTTVTGISPQGARYSTGQIVAIPIKRITYTSEPGRGGDIQNVLSFWHPSPKKQYAELRITAADEIAGIGKMLGVVFELGKAYEGPFTIECLLGEMREGKSGKYPGDFWRAVTGIKRDG